MEANFQQVLEAWKKGQVVDVYNIDVNGNELRLMKKDDVIKQKKIDRSMDEIFARVKSDIKENKESFHLDPTR